MEPAQVDLLGHRALNLLLVLRDQQRKNSDTVSHSWGISRPGPRRHYRRNTRRVVHLVRVHQPSALAKTAGLWERRTYEDRIGQSGDPLGPPVRQDPWLADFPRDSKSRLGELVDENDAGGRWEGR